tara:strand:- start:348 stop:890 length:543 start_codon:yes stop_codon:yes gene_type:complete
MLNKQIDKKKLLSKIMSYLIIISSLLLISFVLYQYQDFFTIEKLKNNDSLVKLYAKEQYNENKKIITKIAIKNGCGKKRLGLVYKRYLLDLGYDITETTNATHENGEYNFGHSSTKILYHKKNKNIAIYLANELGIKKNQIFEDNNKSEFHDLTLILGQNYLNLKSYKRAEKYNPFNNEK